MHMSINSSMLISSPAKTYAAQAAVIIDHCARYELMAAAKLLAGRDRGGHMFSKQKETKNGCTPFEGEIPEWAFCALH